MKNSASLEDVIQGKHGVMRYCTIRNQIKANIEPINIPQIT
jgi:hypothetical protein